MKWFPEFPKLAVATRAPTSQKAKTMLPVTLASLTIHHPCASAAYDSILICTSRFSVNTSVGYSPATISKQLE